MLLYQKELCRKYFYSRCWIKRTSINPITITQLVTYFRRSLRHSSRSVFSNNTIIYHYTNLDSMRAYSIMWDEIEYKWCKFIRHSIWNLPCIWPIVRALLQQRELYLSATECEKFPRINLSVSKYEREKLKDTSLTGLCVCFMWNLFSLPNKLMEVEL